MIFTLWLLVFNCNGLYFRGRFPLDASDDENVYDLKTKVKDMIGGRFSHIIAAEELNIWRCKESETIFDGNNKVLFRQILNVFSPEEKVEVLSTSQKLADLHILEEETLLVETPGTSHISMAFGDILIFTIVKVYTVGNPIIEVPKKVPHKFESFYLQLCTKGGITEEDIEQNDVNVYGASHHIPGFVEEHEHMLAKKRTVSDEVRPISYQLLMLMMKPDACGR